MFPNLLLKNVLKLDWTKPWKKLDIASTWEITVFLFLLVRTLGNYYSVKKESELLVLNHSFGYS